MVVGKSAWSEKVEKAEGWATNKSNRQNMKKDEGGIQYKESGEWHRYHIANANR